MSDLASALVATTVISLISLVGAAVFRGKWWNERNEMRAVSFAAGVLLAAVFLDLLPEAVELWDGTTNVFIGALATMAILFFVERLIHGTHKHHGHESHVHHHSASGYFILLGDGVHNFIDGVAIATAFIISPELGIATTLAVAAHELPHEIADYGILLKSGYSRGRALAYNLISGLTAVLGAGAVFIAGDLVTDNLSFFLTATAGLFLYIACVNLMPELHHQRVKGRLVYGAPFLVGIFTIAALLLLIPHEGHADGKHAPDLIEHAEDEEFNPEETHVD